jgi:hypothetical protein
MEVVTAMFIGLCSSIDTSGEEENTVEDAEESGATLVGDAMDAVEATEGAVCADEAHDACCEVAACTLVSVL